MTRLREQTTVHCPVEEAEARTLAFFDSRRARDGTLRMLLRVPAGGNMPYNYSISRIVRVEASMRRDADGLNDVITISWRPEGTAMLPRFEGKLRVWGGEDPETTIVELDGSYVPPFGVAGQVFDEAIGQQIARSTAHQFLADVRRGIEEGAGSALDVGGDV